MIRCLASAAIGALAAIAAIAYAIGSTAVWMVVAIILAIVFGLPLMAVTLEYWFGPLPPNVKNG